MRGIDERTLRWARTRGHTPRAERAVGRFSRIGEQGAVWLAIGAGGWALDSSRRARWARATGVVAGTFTLNTTIKLIVRRPRPQLPRAPGVDHHPHAAQLPERSRLDLVLAGARVYTRLGLPAPPLYALAALLAASRLYLGVHYPSDILAGALLGTTTAAVAR